MSDRRRSADRRLLPGPSRSRRTRAAGRLRHQRPPRLLAGRRVQRGAHPGHHPGHLRVPRAARHHRPAVPRQGHARALGARASGRRSRCWPPTASTDDRPERTSGYTPTPVDLARHPRATTAGAARRPGRRHRHHAVAQPARATAASSTTRPTAAPPTPTSPTWIAGPRQRSCSREPRRERQAPALRAARCAAATTHQHDFVTAYVDDLRTCIDMEAIRAPALKLGVDPLGGASVAYWSAHRRALRARPRRSSTRRVDPRFAFMTLDHDGKIRMDCSSPYAMASLVGLQGPLRRRLRQRRRRRPPRHRHAVGGPDEPEPLPGRRHPLPVHAPPRAGRRAPPSARRWCRSSLIDRVVASLGRKLLRGAGRLQVVRRRPARRQLRLRRRGERRRQLPAPRRHASGPPTRTASSWACWPPRSPATTGKDPAQHYQELRRAVRRRRTTRASTRRPRPTEKAALQEARRPTAVTATTWPASRSAPS